MALNFLISILTVVLVLLLLLLLATLLLLIPITTLGIPHHIKSFDIGLPPAVKLAVLILAVILAVLIRMITLLIQVLMDTLTMNSSPLLPLALNPLHLANELDHELMLTLTHTDVRQLGLASLLLAPLPSLLSLPCHQGQTLILLRSMPMRSVERQLLLGFQPIIL